MSVTACVPIRLTNERVPGKNIRMLGSKPLCSYLFETLLSVPSLDRICVYCSDESFTKYIPAGIEFVQRDVSLNRNTTLVAHLLEGFLTDMQSDHYVMTHVTSPFIEAQSIERGIQAVVSGMYDSALSVQRIQQYVWHEGKPLNYALSDIPRTQDLTPLYEETSGFFVFDHATGLQKRRIGTMPLLCEVDSIEGVDIDTEEDFIIAEQLLPLAQQKCHTRKAAVCVGI